MASATFFPAGWRMPDRIGNTITNLHKPVPFWKHRLAGSVEK